MSLIIYHGACSPNDLKQASEAAPSFDHGHEWGPHKMTPHDTRYILDNGAFAAFRDGHPWDATGFVKRLAEIDIGMPRPPEFVILPDVVGDSQATTKRATTWAKFLGGQYPLAYPVQDGHDPEEVASHAASLGCVALFIGGTMHWKRRTAADIVEAGHDHGLNVHIGRPGDIGWAVEIGADSVDTTSIVRDQDWDRLRQLEQQETLIA